MADEQTDNDARARNLMSRLMDVDSKIYLGISFGIISYFGSVILQFIYGKEDVFAGFFNDLGLAIITTMITYIMIDKFTNISVMNKINEHELNIQNNMESDINKLKNELGLSLKAEKSGIVDVFTRRKIGREQWKNSIKNAIKNQESGEILFECVAGPKFFRSDGEHYMYINDFISKKMTNKLKVLLLDWEGTWAELRQNLEKPHNPIKDIINSGEHLEELEKKYKGRIEHKYYDFTPIVFMIILEEMLFIETYPIVERAPIGGISPMIIIKSGTKAYDIWKDHFDYVWKNRSESKKCPKRGGLARA